MACGGDKLVTFLVDHGSYKAGDIGEFSEDICAMMVEIGVAQYVTLPEPPPPTRSVGKFKPKPE